MICLVLNSAIAALSIDARACLCLLSTLFGSRCMRSPSPWGGGKLLLEKAKSKVPFTSRGARLISCNSDKTGSCRVCCIYSINMGKFSNFFLLNCCCLLSLIACGPEQLPPPPVLLLAGWLAGCRLLTQILEPRPVWNVAGCSRKQ